MHVYEKVCCVENAQLEFHSVGIIVVFEEKISYSYHVPACERTMAPQFTSSSIDVHD